MDAHLKRNFPFIQFCVVLLVVSFIVSGCITVNLESEKDDPAPVLTVIPLPVSTIQPAAPVLTDDRLLNAEYLSPLMQVPVQLVDGEYSATVDGTELHMTVYPGIAHGDLNADGIEDAALLLSENTGGSGFFVSLLAVYSKDGQFAHTQGVLIDDRPVIKELEIADGVIKLNALVHGPNDPMVDPTTSMRGEYSLFGGRVVLTHLVTAFGGGGEHAINIDTPIDGEFVSGTVQVQGSMPIGPFENNLSMLISNPLIGQLAHEGFMVQAPEMGAPATFDNPVTIPDVPAGTQILLVLSELSMADGTPMALDSVLLVAE